MHHPVLHRIPRVGRDRLLARAPHGIDVLGELHLLEGVQAAVEVRGADAGDLGETVADERDLLPAVGGHAPLDHRARHAIRELDQSAMRVGEELRVDAALGDVAP